MGKYGVVKDCYISVAGVDLSDHCSSLDPVYGNNQLPMHTMGNNQEYFSPGLRTRSLSAKFLMDFASGSVFATLNPLKNGAYHVVQYRHDNSDGASALNPTYSGLYFISNATGLIGGAIGAQSECTITWTAAGDEAELTS